MRQRARARRLETSTLSVEVQEGKSLSRPAARRAAEIKTDSLRCLLSAHCREVLAALATALPEVVVAAQAPTETTLCRSLVVPAALDDPQRSTGQRTAAAAAEAEALAAPQEARAARVAAAPGQIEAHLQPWQARRIQAAAEAAAAAHQVRGQPDRLEALALSCCALQGR